MACNYSTMESFMVHVFHFSDVDKLYNLVMILLGFYVQYVVQNVFDSEFYSLGKTDYLLREKRIHIWEI